MGEGGREGGRERKKNTDRQREREVWVAKREAECTKDRERERGLDNLEATSIRDKVVREYIIIIIHLI